MRLYRTLYPNIFFIKFEFVYFVPEGPGKIYLGDYLHIVSTSTRLRNRTIDFLHDLKTAVQYVTRYEDGSFR